MQEDTKKVYVIPVPRFNKAAAYLLQTNVMDGLASCPTSKTHCRCARGCAAHSSVDSILASSLWFFEHPTHDDAVVELAKVMATT